MFKTLLQKSEAWKKVLTTIEYKALLAHETYRAIDIGPPRAVAGPPQAVAGPSANNESASEHNIHGFQVKAEVLRRETHPGFVSALAEHRRYSSPRNTTNTSMPPAPPNLLSATTTSNPERSSSLQPSHADSSSILTRTIPIPQKESSSGSPGPSKIAEELGNSLSAGPLGTTRSPSPNPHALGSMIVQCIPYLQKIGLPLPVEAPYPYVNPQLLGNSGDDNQAQSDNVCPAPPAPSAPLPVPSPILPPPQVVQQPITTESLALSIINNPTPRSPSSAPTPSPTPPPPGQRPSASGPRTSRSGQREQGSHSPCSNRKDANSSTISSPNAGSASNNGTFAFKGGSGFDISPQKAKTSSSSSSSSSSDTSREDSDEVPSKGQTKSGGVSPITDSMEVDSDKFEGRGVEKEAADGSDTVSSSSSGSNKSNSRGKKDSSREFSKSASPEIDPMNVDVDGKDEGSDKGSDDGASEPKEDGLPRSRHLLSHDSGKVNEGGKRSARLGSRRKIINSESEEDEDPFLQAPAAKPLKTTIGRLTRAFKKRNPPKKQTAISDDQMVVDSADDELEEEEETTGYRPTTPLPRCEPIPSDEEKFKELQREASTLLNGKAYTESGLESSEASLILAAVLSLEGEERQMFLDIPHNDLVAGFKMMSKKKSMKHRETDHLRSPEHKRPRRGQ